MNLDIGANTKTNKTFELVLQVRDKDGAPTGKTKQYFTDDPVKLHRFFIRNSGWSKKKRKKADAAKSHKEVEHGLKEAENYTKIIRRKRKLED